MDQEAIQSSPEFLMMKAKHPSIKNKYEEAFPLCHELVPADIERFHAKNEDL